MLWQFRFLFCHTFVARGSWQKIMYLSHLIVKFHPIHSHASYAAAHFKLQNNSNESNWIKSHQYGWKCRLEVKQQMACLFQLHATLNLSHDAAASLLIFLSANSFICCFICCGESNEIRVFFLKSQPWKSTWKYCFRTAHILGFFIPSNGKLNYIDAEDIFLMSKINLTVP